MMLSVFKINLISCFVVASTFLICFTSAQQAPVYNRRLFDVSTFRSMFPFRNGKAVPFHVAQAQQFLPLLKKSDARWEDLGWAWGKRSNDEYFLPPSTNLNEVGVSNLVSSPSSTNNNNNEGGIINDRRQTRSMKQVKKNPDWHDLGWAWGRK